MANADTVASELALALRSLPTGVDHATVVLQGRSLGPWPSPAAQSTATGHRRASRASRASLSVHNAQHGAWPGSAAAEAATFVPPMAAGGEASGAAPDLEAARLQLRGRMMEVLVDVARHTQRRVTVVSSPGGGVATAEVRCPPATTSGRVRTSGATAGVASEVLMVHVATGSALPPPPPPDAAASPPPPRPAPPQQMPAVSSNETMATAATARVVPGTARDRGAPRGKGSQDIEGITENEEHRDAGTAGSQRKSASVDGAWAARRPSILSHIVSRFSGDASPIPTPVPLSGGLWEARMRPPHASAGVWAGWCLFHPGALPVHSPLAMHARKAAPTFVETGGPRKEARPAGNRAVKADAPPGCFLLRCFAKPRVAEAQPPLPGDPWAKLSQDLRPGSPRLPAEAETVPVGGLMAPAPGTEKGMGMGATRSRGRGPGDEKKIATGFGAFVRRSLNLPGPWNERQPAEVRARGRGHVVRGIRTSRSVTRLQLGLICHAQPTRVRRGLSPTSLCFAPSPQHTPLFQPSTHPSAPAAAPRGPSSSQGRRGRGDAPDGAAGPGALPRTRGDGVRGGPPPRAGPAYGHGTLAHQPRLAALLPQPVSRRVCARCSSVL